MADSEIEWRPTLRLWGAQQWGSGTTYHGDSPLDHRTDYSFRATSPEISVGFQMDSPSLFVNGELGIGFLSMTTRRPPQDDASSTMGSDFPLEEETGFSWSLHVRARVGVWFDSFGPYAIVPGGSFVNSGSDGVDLNAVGIGAGSFFLGGIILAEVQYSLLEREGDWRSSYWDGRLFEVRAGVDLVRLFSDGEAPPAPPRPQVQQPPLPTPPPPLPPPQQVTSSEPPRAQIERGQIQINQRIHFDFNRADIRPDSYPILDAVAEVLRVHPEIQVQVQGHADDVGTDEYNLVLSRRRADAVMTYLIQRGIEPSRLEAAGFGRSRPLVSGTTEEARATNRRTEFLILPAQGL